MSKLIACLFAGLFAASISFAQAPPRTADPESVMPEAAKRTAPPSIVLPAMPAQANCESKAIGKNGMPLARAAKAAFMKKCESEIMKLARANCEAKAVGQDGKRLPRTEKAIFMKNCESDAKATR